MMGVLHVRPRDTNSPIRWEQGDLRNPSRRSRGNAYIGTLDDPLLALLG
jgi:hypothetical protein